MEALRPAATLGRRLACMLYEAFVAVSLLFIAAFAFQGATSGPLEGWSRHVFQGYLFLVLGLYFVWSWARGGQTLPMKTWRLQLVRRDGAPIDAIGAMQ